MFISRKEKEELQAMVQGLQIRLHNLEIETLWLKSRINKDKRPVIKTDEAPWGYKKDGIPRKRPGRPAQVMEITS